MPDTTPPVATEREVLAELVACKDLKTTAAAIETSGSWSAVHRQREMLEQYRHRKAIAWDLARALLAQPRDEAKELRQFLQAANENTQKWKARAQGNEALLRQALGDLDSVMRMVRDRCLSEHLGYHVAYWDTKIADNAALRARLEGTKP
jgi:hypothetical protein